MENKPFTSVAVVITGVALLRELRTRLIRWPDQYDPETSEIANCPFHLLPQRQGRWFYF